MSALIAMRFESNGIKITASMGEMKGMGLVAKRAP
jgi:hypothetical protein